MNWQSIDTAPRDGTTILLCETNGYIVTGYWYETPFLSGRWCDGCADGCSIPAKFWMPLPNPPEVS